MASRTIKKLTEFERRLNQVIDKTDYEEMDFGELELQDDGVTFEPEDAAKVENIVKSLKNVITQLEAAKDNYVQRNLQLKLQEVLSSGGQQATQLVSILSGEKSTNESQSDVISEQEDVTP